MAWTAEEDALLTSMRQQGHTFREIADKLGKGRTTCGERWAYLQKEEPDPPRTCAPLPQVTHPHIDADPNEVLERARAAWQKTQERLKRKAAQAIRFTHGPIGLAFMADLHVGGCGVDYDRLWHDADIIADTPGLYLATVGDIVNNFVWLLAELMQQTLTIPDEWCIARHFLERVAHKHLLAVGGNHDLWTRKAAGIDYFADLVRQSNPNILYDRHDLRATLHVGNASWRLRGRHAWKGSSIYNETHGIERAAKWDQDFEVGFGAHDHINAECRSFTVAGKQGMAVKCGTYKIVDEYAETKGFSLMGPHKVAVIIFDDSPPSLSGFTCLEAASKYLAKLYDGTKASHPIRP